MYVLQRLLIFVMLGAAIVGCSSGGSSALSSPWEQALEQVRSAVAGGRGYSLQAVEVTASPTLLRIAIGDAQLAQADQLTRENAANAIVAAAENVLPQQAVLATVQVINVAIIHPGPSAETHTEDVLEFRKGPSGRFAHHVT